MDPDARTESAPARAPLPPPHEKDDGLRRLLTWTIAAIVVVVVLTYFGVELAIRLFDTPQ